MKHRSGYCLMSLEGVPGKKSKIRIEAGSSRRFLILARRSEDVTFDKNVIMAPPPGAAQPITLCEFS